MGKNSRRNNNIPISSRPGEIKELPGIHSVYKEPIPSGLILDSCQNSVQQNVGRIMKYLKYLQYKSTTSSLIL